MSDDNNKLSGYIVYDNDAILFDRGVMTTVDLNQKLQAKPKLNKFQ